MKSAPKTDTSGEHVQRTTEPGPRTAVAVLVFELVALALLFWLAMGLV